MRRFRRASGNAFAPEQPFIELQPISARDLELIALQNIRALPGTEYVMSAHIERAEFAWALIVSVKEGADIPRIQDAVRKTEHDLQNRYKLLDNDFPAPS